MRNPRRRNLFGRTRHRRVVNGRAMQSRFHPAEGGAAAVLPANASLARVLASHVLRDGEIVLLVLRPSIWFILLTSLRFVAAAGVLILVVRWHSLAERGLVRGLIELGVSAISARLMWATLQWMSRLYVLTDMRILSVSGVFHIHVFDCPLRKVARTRLTRSPQEKLTGVGSIEIIPQDDSFPFGQWEMIGQPVLVHEQIVATINRARQGGSMCE